MDVQHGPVCLQTLSARQRPVLGLMAQGRSNQAIGERLGMRKKTVESHVRHIFGTLRLPASAADERRVLAVLRYLEAARCPAGLRVGTDCGARGGWGFHRPRRPPGRQRPRVCAGSRTTPCGAVKRHDAGTGQFVGDLDFSSFINNAKLTTGEFRPRGLVFGGPPAASAARALRPRQPRAAGRPG